MKNASRISHRSGLVGRTYLTRADLSVSRLAFGGSRLHYLQSERERQDLMSVAVEMGITHFDVAPLYGYGLAERSLGAFARGRADRLTIATKWGLPGATWTDALPAALLPYGVLGAVALRKAFGAPKRPSLTPSLLSVSVEASLRRLGVERIDVLWMHEPELHLFDDFGALVDEQEKLRLSGKVRCFGVAGSARSVYPVLDAFDEPGLLLQCGEHEWRPHRPPEFAYGAIAQGPQRRTASAISTESAAERLKKALSRRPDGCVIVSTTKTENLRTLATTALTGSC